MTKKARAVYMKQYHADHPWLSLNSARIQRVRKNRLLNNLRNRPCLDCQGWYEPYQMEFDHRDRTLKIDCISTILRHGSWLTLKTELAKCDVVCANCHKVRTYKRGDQGHKGY